jgi:hypothetical protein
MSAFNEAGCAPGASLVEMGGPKPRNPTAGSGGGYGRFYCFALTPLRESTPKRSARRIDAEERGRYPGRRAARARPEVVGPAWLPGHGADGRHGRGRIAAAELHAALHGHAAHLADGARCTGGSRRRRARRPRTRAGHGCAAPSGRPRARASDADGGRGRCRARNAACARRRAASALGGHAVRIAGNPAGALAAGADADHQPVSVADLAEGRLGSFNRTAEGTEAHEKTTDQPLRTNS